MKSRCSRSRARSSAASSTIVLCFLPRRTPSRPSRHISRATWSRPTSTSRRRNSFQVFRYTVDRAVALAGPRRSGRRSCSSPSSRARTASGTCARSTCSPARPPPHRSARPRRPPAVARCSGSPSPGRVELRREIHRRVLQDHVRVPQLRDLLTQPLQLLPLLTRKQITPATTISLRRGAPTRATPHGGCRDRNPPGGSAYHDSNANRTARSRNSNGYFLGASIAGASPSPRTTTRIRILHKTRCFTVDQIAALRADAAGGVSRRELAARYGVSLSYLSRLLTGDRRVTVEPAAGETMAAVEMFLEGLDLDAAGRVRAASARALAAKIDSAAASATGWLRSRSLGWWIRWTRLWPD